MSMGKRGKTTNAARERVAIQAQAERESMIGEMPGRVVSFDPVKQTITVQPTYRPIHDGKPVDMPELQEVPVRFPRAGGFTMTTPVKPGDIVTLRPQMRSSEEYHTGGSHESPKDTRSMSLSDMEAFLDGGEPLTDPIVNFNNDNFEIRSTDGNFKFEMSEDGKFKIVGAEGNWYELVAQLAELLAIDNLDVKYGSSIGQGHALQKRAEYAEIGAKLRAMVL
jgi:hypothetical protein